jgi:hypothetical protein
MSAGPRDGKQSWPRPWLAWILLGLQPFVRGGIEMRKQSFGESRCNFLSRLFATLLCLAISALVGCGDSRPVQPPNGQDGTSKPPPPPPPAYLSVESDPPGADVEVGPKNVNGIYQPGTGRRVGRTPCKVELKPSDLSVTKGFASIVVNLEKPGYIPASAEIGLGNNAMLEPGKTYTVSQKLRKIGTAP